MSKLTGADIAKLLSASYHHCRERKRGGKSRTNDLPGRASQARRVEKQDTEGKMTFGDTTRRLLGTASVALPLLLATACGGTSGSPAPLASACVKSPSEVAAGLRGSVYIEDAQGITHYAGSGKLLFRLHAVKDSSIVSDGAGNLYYATPAGIVEVSPEGRVLRRFAEPGYQPEAVE